MFYPKFEIKICEKMNIPNRVRTTRIFKYDVNYYQFL